MPMNPELDLIVKEESLAVDVLFPQWWNLPSEQLLSLWKVHSSTKFFRNF
eukprot:CAMPEP_0185777318 /NCGR_PEP_ID=MMETSP1174-20130828/89003_1 /TAXON_ID=35687 /ORGANISM="Dictyocha speculum, Strain CCMP1381" /LENGTH=49 /DNA_ID= /DNA_START= /DNA_END= /DNA_ORIENTATION=